VIDKISKVDVDMVSLPVAKLVRARF